MNACYQLKPSGQVSYIRNLLNNNNPVVVSSSSSSSSNNNNNNNNNTKLLIIITTTTLKLSVSASTTNTVKMHDVYQRYLAI